MKKLFLGLFLIFGLTIGLLNLDVKAEGETYTLTVNYSVPGQTINPLVVLNNNYGTLVTVDAPSQGEDYAFAGIVVDGKVSEGLTKSFRIYEDTQATIYYKPVNTKVIIVKDSNDDSLLVLYTETNGVLSSNDQTLISNLSNPTKPGLSFSSWSVSGFSTAFTQDTLVYPIFTTNINDLGLTITNGEASVEGPYSFNQVVTVTANGTGTFNYWLKDGLIASLDQTYTFTMAGSHELEAVYNADFVADSNIFVGVSEIYEDLNPGYATIVGQIDLPADEELVEWGIITSQMAGGITFDTPDVKIFNSNKLNAGTNVFVLSFTKAASYPNYRAFVKTINTTTSVVTTTYSYIQDYETLYTYANDLFISEYLDWDGGTNKAIEIFNGTENAIDFSGYSIKTAANGAISWTNSTTTPSNLIIPANGSIVLVNSDDSLPELVNLKDATTTATFNGDDTIGLFKGTQLIDIFGVLGKDPGASWTIEGGTTADSTVIRKPSVNSPFVGITTIESIEYTSWNSEQWYSTTQTLNNLGSHSMDYNPIERPIIIDSSYTPSSITINGDSIVNVGETLSLSTTEDVVWFSSNNDILTVNQNGLVSGVAVGSATVYAYSYYNHNVFDEKTITVNQIQVYNVTFNYNDGVTTPLVLNVNGGATVTEPTDPTRSGYQFAGWYSDSELTTLYNFSSPVVSNVTLYAKWLEEFTVTFNSNGGSPVASQTVVYGNLVIEPNDPILADYLFAGWYSNAELTTMYNFSSAVTSDITLYAKWNQTSTTPVIVRQSDFGTTNGWSVYSIVTKDINHGSLDPSYPGTSSWTILGGNVNNSGWDFIRMGGKQASSNTNPNVYLETEFTFASHRVTSIVVNIVGLDSADGNETLWLQTSTDGITWTDLTSKVITSIGDLVFESLNISSDTYFRFVFQRNSTTDNKGTDIKTITFYGLPE